MEVTLEKNVFSPSELNYIFKSIFQKENECKWSIQKHSWEDAIQNSSLGVVSLFRISGELHDMIVKILQKYLKPGEAIKSIQYYEWNQLSQINWHNDEGKKGAITVYLNDQWDPNWGGFFCWQESAEKTHLLIPQFNSAIVVRGNPPHHVSLISPYAPSRKTLQIWLDDAQIPHALSSPP